MAMPVPTQALMSVTISTFDRFLLRTVICR